MVRTATRVSSAKVLLSRRRPRPMFWFPVLFSAVISEIERDAIVMLTFHFLSSTPKSLLFLVPKPQFLPAVLKQTTMSISLSSHAFAGNPIRSRTPKPTSQFSPNAALESLKSRILNWVPSNSLAQFGSLDFKVLPFRKGRPLATSREDEGVGPRWRLRWMGLDECVRLLGKLSDERFVYLGWRDKGSDGDDDDGVVYWAIDVSDGGGEVIGDEKEKGWCFVELRTLMVATDWEDQSAMGELAIAGHVSVRVRVYGTPSLGIVDSVDQSCTCIGLF